jgi:uncharacterized protein (TIGR00730 family)
MEAANRGASEAGGRSVGLNIGLPHEQRPNPHTPRELSFEFHYFFMRKLWFASLARALVVFPGGFGTFDELFEVLTLAQTRKLERSIPVVLYGSDYWNEVINFEALARRGMIDREDLSLFHFADEPNTALASCKKGSVRAREGSPSIRAFSPAAFYEGLKAVVLNHCASPILRWRTYCNRRTTRRIWEPSSVCTAEIVTHERADFSSFT